MRTRRALVALTLALLLGATATACGPGSSSGTGETATQSESASTEPFVGAWLIESEAFPSGTTYTRADLDATDSLIVLEVNADGTFTMSDGNRQTEDEWEPTGDTTATFWADGTPARVTVNDGRLTLKISDGPVMVFTRS